MKERESKSKREGCRERRGRLREIECELMPGGVSTCVGG